MSYQVKYALFVSLTFFLSEGQDRNRSYFFCTTTKYKHLVSAKYLLLKPIPPPKHFFFILFYYGKNT